MSEELGNARKTIVHVDDEEVVLHLYAEELTEVFGDKFKFIPFLSADDALDYLRSDKPDLVISNIVMPGMNGLDFLREVKSLYHDIPFIICSSLSSYKGDPRSVGADWYVVKSNDLSELFKAIESATHVERSSNQATIKQNIYIPTSAKDKCKAYGIKKEGSIEILRLLHKARGYSRKYDIVMREAKKKTSQRKVENGREELLDINFVRIKKGPRNKLIRINKLVWQRDVKEISFEHRLIRKRLHQNSRWLNPRSLCYPN